MNPRIFIQEKETGRYVLYAFKTSKIYYKRCSLQTVRLLKHRQKNRGDYLSQRKAVLEALVAKRKLKK